MLKRKGKLTICIETIKLNILPSVKHSIGRHNVYYYRKYHSDGRQSASSFCACIVTADGVHGAIEGSIMTAEGVHDTMGWSTMSAERVLATNAEILRRPTEYFRNLRKHRDGRESTRCDRMKYYDGRQST